MDVLVFKDKVWDLMRSINENVNNTFLRISEEHGLTMLQFRCPGRRRGQHRHIGPLFGCCQRQRFFHVQAAGKGRLPFPHP